MKRILIAAMAGLAAAALTGCRPAGPKTTVIEVVEPVPELIELPMTEPAAPPPETPTVEPPPASPEEADTLHTVQQGDTLMSIARKYYEDASRYKDIAEANNIADPDKIYIGQVLKIPD